MGSFIGPLKSELVHQRQYHTCDEASPDLFFYIEGLYNRAGDTRRWAISARRPMSSGTINDRRFAYPTVHQSRGRSGNIRRSKRR